MRQIAEAAEHASGQALALPVVGDDHRQLGSVGAFPPHVAGDPDDLPVDDGDHRLTVVVIDVEEAFGMRLFGAHYRTVEAAVDGRGRESVEEPEQCCPVRWFETGQPDVTRRRRLHRDHLSTSSPESPDQHLNK